MRLYKYLPKKYLDAFFRRGSLKIGTLYEYRNTEQYGLVIGDQDEGVHRTSLTLTKGDKIDLGSNTLEADFFRNALAKPIEQTSNIKIVALDSGYTLKVQSQSPDLYIYCMSSRYDKEVMRQFGCDSCIEIIDPMAFLATISHRIRHKARFDGFAPICYMSRDTHYKNPHRIHPAIMKDIDFQYQDEWRAIWVPIKTSREPLIIEVPKAISHCKRYEL